MKQTDSSVLCTGRLRPLTAGLDANVSKPWRESFLSFHHNLINLDSKYRKLDCNVSEYPASAKKAATRLSLARPFYMHAAVDALHNIHVSIYIHICVCVHVELYEERQISCSVGPDKASSESLFAARGLRSTFQTPEGSETSYIW